MEPIRIVVQGALGRMGREIINALCREPDMQIVGAVELEADKDSLPLPDGYGTVPFSSSLEHIITTCRPNVLVDFTNAKVTLSAVRIATKHRVNLVIGTTGLTADDLKEIERLALSSEVGAVVAPNFTVGAVLMIHLAKIAAKYLDAVEIMELHHNLKLDAPSGTALSTARAMAQARGKPFSLTPQQSKNFVSRGEMIDGIAIHSVRLPGLMAHQEVLFGAPGQTLSIRHDTISRECYMPGIIMAIKKVAEHKGLVYGLDTLLGL